MSDDDLFRLLYLIGFVTVFPFALYHRIRSNSGESLDRWQEGAVILFGLRLTALPAFIGKIAWLINPRWMAWSSMPFPLWVRWTGFAVLVVSAALLVWTFRNLGKNLTDTVVTRKDHTLVTTGPYRYVRHPFYLTFFLAVLGGGIVAANWFVLLFGMFPVAFIVARTSIEEEHLINRFGDDYRDYMQRTGRFIPRLR